MQRRRFLSLTSIAALFLSHRTARSQAPSQQAGSFVVLKKVPIAGTQYYEAMNPTTLSEIRMHDVLFLKREPTNKYDGDAIEICMRDGRKLGYIPRTDNDTPARLLDSGFKLRAHVASVSQSPDPWERIQIQIVLVS